MGECMGLFGYVFGHRFRARTTTTYDMVPAIRSAIEMGRNVSIKEFSTVPVETYHGDICTRCGDRRPTPTGGTDE